MSIFNSLIISYTIVNTNNIISDYQSAVDRIGKRAKELMLPELKKRESSSV